MNFSHPYGSAVEVTDGRVRVVDPSVLATDKTDALVRSAVFGDGAERDTARWLLWEIGQAVGVRAASIHELYIARGRGECDGFTVPAMNIRGRAYDTMRSVFRVAIRRNAGA